MIFTTSNTMTHGNVTCELISAVTVAVIKTHRHTQTHTHTRKQTHTHKTTMMR